MFRDWLIHEKIASPEEVKDALLTQETRDYSTLQIRAEMVNLAFGREAWHRVSSQGDKQLSSALGQFDRAAELLSQRRGLDHGGAQRAAAGSR